MNDAPTEHLVIYPLPPLGESDDRHRFAYINLNQLTGVYWYFGYRSFKSDEIKHRKLKIWQKKHPMLSKFFTPFELWPDSFLISRWHRPGVVIIHGSIKQSYVMPSNEVAERVACEIKDKFWSKIE